MDCTDTYGLQLTTSPEAAAAWSKGLRNLLALQRGAAQAFASAIALDPTFAVGHATMALLSYELCVPADLSARTRDALLHAARGTERERSHVHAVVSHLGGDSRPLLAHVRAHPRDALLLSVAVPTIAFSGATEVPAEAWGLVEGAIPAYGDDWWFLGLLGFIRAEQGRFDEAMDLSLCSLAAEPSAGHSAHARAHAHYETGDHEPGLRWMDEWISGDGSGTESLSHFAWHAALHELSLGDLESVRTRYDAQLHPDRGLGCRGLVDTGSLLFRWAITPGATDVPGLERVAEVAGRDCLERPATPFLALHAAVVLLALGDDTGLARLGRWSAAQSHPAQREVVAPLVAALRLVTAGRAGAGADGIGALAEQLWRLGGSDAQREVVEEIRIAALLRAGRLDEARVLLDRRLDRRRSPRDAQWRSLCRPTQVPSQVPTQLPAGAA